MSDNAFSYVNNRSLRELLEARAIHHLRTRPYTPKTNGKVERYQQTLAREWGYGMAYRSSEDRDGALPHWLAYYNERRHHSAIGDRPPMARVRNVLGQDS
ncbi:MAG: transposase [Thermoleophilaceae bacterium]|nr:transposase [Thermoleophilaceae bacterium]